jgi:hypothetical protein
MLRETEIPHEQQTAPTDPVCGMASALTLTLGCLDLSDSSLARAASDKRRLCGSEHFKRLTLCDHQAWRPAGWHPAVGQDQRSGADRL